MLDIQKTILAFNNYMSDFDQNDPKIKLKLEHTYHVLKITEYLCDHEHITGTQKQLALIIALLHDIGRFEQVRLYHSYNDLNIDHAKVGVFILFEKGLIKDFVEDRNFDEIIKTAIACHSLYALPQIKDHKILLQCKLIRDADKLDNFRIRQHVKIETLFDISEEEFLSQKVSDSILDVVKEHRLILKAERKNQVDMWVSYFAFVFDLCFQSSYQYLIETNYIERNMERFDFQGELKSQMEFVKDECTNYIKSKMVR